MGYALLWIEGLAVALVCLALLARRAAFRGSFFRVFLLILVLLFFAGPAAFLTHATASWQSQYGKFLPPDLFLYPLSWLVVYLVSASVLLRQAFHRPAVGVARLGSSWSGKQLCLALGGMVLALGLTFWQLDLAARADLTIARQEAGDVLLIIAPPQTAEADNTARLYVEAGKNLITPVRNPWYDAALQGRSADPRGEVNWRDPYIVELVGKQEQVLTLLRKVAALPDCSLDRHRSIDDLDAWRESGLWQLRRDEEILLAVDARVKAAQGDLKRAFEDIAALLGFTQHTQTFLSGPGLLGTQFRAWHTLEDVLRLAPEKEPIPAVILPEGLSPARILLREMAVFGMIWPVWLSDNPLRVGELRKDLGAWGKPPLAFLIDTLITPTCRVSLTPAELTYARKKWALYRRVIWPAEGNPRDWELLQQMVQTEPTGLFSALYIKPKEQKLLSEAGKLAALSRLAHAGLAAARYRDKHGKYPQRLEQLVPEFFHAMPVDPRDGRGLAMKHFSEVTVLYTLQNSASLETEKAWDPEKHREEPLFRLFPRGRAK